MSKRKRKVISCILSVAMILGLATGSNIKVANANDASTTDKLEFNVYFESFGTIWGWSGTPAGEQTSVNVDSCGTYTLKATATSDANSWGVYWL